MNLAAYTELIKHLPYKDQAFETQKVTWESFADREPFVRFYSDVFSQKEMVTISREDLFTIAKKDPYKAVLATILWGYPRGYTRGNTMIRLFPLFLNHVEYLAGHLSTQKSITAKELREILKNCKGVGLSTLSKLLYFFNVKVEGCKCLIMDARIIGVLSKGQFAELAVLSGVREHNKELFYTEYLKVFARLSKMNGYKPDQLELFLFMFGNNLKQNTAL